MLKYSSLSNTPDLVVQGLKNRKDFLRVQGKGKRFKSKHLILLSHPQTLEYPRVGITLSRRVGNAVMRNKIRRRLREIIRLNKNLFSSLYDYVIIVSPKSARSNYKTLETELCHLLKKTDKTFCESS